MAKDSTHMRVYAFGDQTYNVADALLQLLRAHEDPLVLDFLERSASTIQREIACLTPEQQGRCPRFATIANLVPHYRAGTLNPALSQALTCVAQLGTFLR